MSDGRICDLVDHYMENEKIGFLDNFTRLPQTPETLDSVQLYNVTCFIFDIPKSPLGLSHYLLFLWIKTECGPHLAAMHAMYYLKNLRYFNLYSLLYIGLVLAITPLYLPVFLFKTRNLSRKWNPLMIGTHYHRSLSDVRSYYIQENLQV